MEYPGSLHNHTDYSNLRIRDSINTYKDIIDYAIELGHKVIAITEHESISNAVKVEKYYKKIKEKNPDFKVILGNEIYLCRDGLTSENFNNDKFYHFILLAKDAEGHRQIRELSTRAWLRSFKWKGLTRVPTYYQDLIDVIVANPGHVIGSTACLGGFLGTKILKCHEEQNQEDYKLVFDWLKLMKKIFGDDFYLEMQPSANKEQIIVNKGIINLSNSLGIPYIITTDSHYLKKEEASIHKAFLNSQDGDREVDEFYSSTYMMSTKEVEGFINYLTREQLDKAYNSILDIANKCEDYSLLKKLKIPNLPWKEQKEINKEELEKYFNLIPKLKDFYESDWNSDKKLVTAIINGIKEKEDLQCEEAYTEINKNLEMTWTSSRVNNAEWSAYFLNLQKIVEECWNANTLVGCGRGSGVGFILLYVLNITQINPLRETTRTFPWRLTQRV